MNRTIATFTMGAAPCVVMLAASQQPRMIEANNTIYDTAAYRSQVLLRIVPTTRRPL